MIKTVNREIYPEVDYPFGQYDYQVYFEQSFEKVTQWFESDHQGVLKAVYSKGRPDEVGKPAATSTVTRDGGWIGGSPIVPPVLRAIPVEALCISEALFNQVVEGMSNTGFHGANSWYMNHKDNRAYALNNSKHDGHLHMPVLFIGANWDPISDVAVSSIANEQKKYCAQLKEVYLDAGHWVALERPQEVNSTVIDWLHEVIPESQRSE